MEYATQWFPGTESVQRVGSADAPTVPGTKFLLQTNVAGLYKMAITYQVTEYDMNKRIVCSALSEVHTSRDQIIFMPDRNDPNFTVVRFISDIQLREWRAFMEPILGGMLTKIPEEALKGLAQVLGSSNSPIYTRSFEERLRRLSPNGRSKTAGGGGRYGESSTQRQRQKANIFSNIFGGASFSGRGDTATATASYSSVDTAVVAAPPTPDVLGYYAIMGLTQAANASPEELKAAYRRTAMLYHPDRQLKASERQRREAAEKFALLNAAYETLKDPEKRQRYDEGKWMDMTASF